MADFDYGNLLSDLLSTLLKSENGPLYYFYQLLFGYTKDGYEFHPDINGYTLMFMLPPHLSGYGYTTSFTGSLGTYCKMMCFLGVDFTPPQSQIVPSDLPSRSGALPFGVEFSPQGQLGMTYIDDQHQRILAFHKIWTNYIEDIVRGIRSDNGSTISPSSEYYTTGNTKFGQLDYATSAYVVRFKPVYNIRTSMNINYVGKATGIFPLSIPDKEAIGRRDSNELVTYSIPYACAWYRQWVLGTPDMSGNSGKDIYIVSEFYDKILSAYSS